MNKVVDTAFFEQPGFRILYETWLEVFERDDTGRHIVPVQNAVKMLREARIATLSEGVSSQDAFTLESVACRYAQEIPIQVSEAAYA